MNLETYKDIYVSGVILKAYVWYDGPILWSFKHLEDIYLGYNNVFDMDKGYAEYILIQFDKELEKKAEAGEIGIKDLFKNADKVYGVREYFYGKKPAEYKIVENLTDDMFPENIDNLDINYFKYPDMDESCFNE